MYKVQGGDPGAASWAKLASAAPALLRLQHTHTVHTHSHTHVVGETRSAWHAVQFLSPCSLSPRAALDTTLHTGAVLYCTIFEGWGRTIHTHTAVYCDSESMLHIWVLNNHAKRIHLTIMCPFLWWSIQSVLQNFLIPQTAITPLMWCSFLTVTPPWSWQLLHKKRKTVLLHFP